MPAPAEPAPADVPQAEPTPQAEPIPPTAASADVEIRYHLERIEVRGNRTRAELIRRYVPMGVGESFDVDDPEIEAIRWRLMGTGWFDEVRLHLERGSRRGWVVLVIDVQERNTLVISQVVAGLSRVVTSSTSKKDSLRPYGGLGVREHNLFGLGIGVGATAVVSEHQFGVDLRYHDPTVLGSKFSLDGRAFYNDAREFFGLNPLVAIYCPEPDPGDPPNPDPCDPDVLAERAVVIYDRGGVSIGTGREVTRHLRYQLEWLGELVDVAARPRSASNQRGGEIVPIDFHIDDDLSVVSSLRLGLVFDRRDDPALPSDGQLAELRARFGTGLLGSTYDFARFEASFRQYVPLSWGHVLTLGVYAGTVFGRAPFFYRFYAADLSDLLPDRVLELNLDHRRTHNLLGTSIIEHDKAELAGRLDFEYQLPLHRGGGEVRGVDLYFGGGIFFLSDRDSLRVAITGYDGLSRVPVDLTFDLGVQADTSIGLFKVGFSTLVGFLPDLGQETP